MSAGVARQRVEQCFRVALVQDPIANLREAEMWARSIREASALQAPRRDGESEKEPYFHGICWSSVCGFRSELGCTLTSCAENTRVFTSVF